MEEYRNDCPPKNKYLNKAISIFIYYAISTSLRLLISSSATTFSQDLSKSWSGLHFEFPRHFQSTSVFHELLTLLLTIYQYIAGTTQAFNSIESFSWYKWLSLTIIFNTLPTGLDHFEILDYVSPFSKVIIISISTISHTPCLVLC